MTKNSGIYWLNLTLSRDDIEKASRREGFTFYYVDGNVIEDHLSLYDALTHTFTWPIEGKGNWDAIWDVITDPLYYAPNDRGVIVFDQFHRLAKNDPKSFETFIGILSDIPKRFDEYLKHPKWHGRKPIRVYVLLRGEISNINSLSAEDFV